MRNVYLLVLCLCCMVTAQTLWKQGLTQIGIFDLASPSTWGQLLKIFKSIRMLGGMFLFAISTLLWFDLLSRMELSLLYPFMSLSYVLAFFTGWFWLGESPQISRLLGIGVICLGIFLVARTTQ